MELLSAVLEVVGIQSLSRYISSIAAHRGMTLSIITCKCPNTLHVCCSTRCASQSKIVQAGGKKERTISNTAPFGFR